MHDGVFREPSSGSPAPLGDIENDLTENQSFEGWAFKQEQIEYNIDLIPIIQIWVYLTEGFPRRGELYYSPRWAARMVERCYSIHLRAFKRHVSYSQHHTRQPGSQHNADFTIAVELGDASRRGSSRPAGLCEKSIGRR